MKVIYTFFLMLFAAVSFLQAQETGRRLRGRVVGRENVPVPYATVALLRDSVIVLGTVSDSTGVFRFEGVPSGDYTFYVSYMGYEEVSRELPAGVTDLGTIVLDPAAIQTEEVVVTGRMP